MTYFPSEVQRTEQWLETLVQNGIYDRWKFIILSFYNGSFIYWLCNMLSYLQEFEDDFSVRAARQVKHAKTFANDKKNQMQYQMKTAAL